MKSTFITTVFNEEDSIENFLLSLSKQTKYPDEIIIVDSFSVDKTVEKILYFQKQNKNLKIKLIKKKGNIATGRNEAIENSTGEVILCSDAGCVLDKNWVKNILDKFEEKSVDVVAGFYKPVTDNVFEKCLATYTCVMLDKIDKENFLPSSRSVGFKKSAWKQAGKYPQWLDTCEDLYFSRELKRKKFNFVFAKNAIVFWPQRKNLKEAFIQFFNYAKGDGVARYIRPNTPFLFARYILGLLLVFYLFKTHSSALFTFLILLFSVYVLWSIQKNYKYIKDAKAFIYLPLLQFTSDIAVISGMSLGMIDSLSIKKNKK